MSGAIKEDNNRPKQDAEKEGGVVLGYDIGFRDGYQAGFDEGRKRIESVLSLDKDDEQQ